MSDKFPLIIYDLGSFSHFGIGCQINNVILAIKLTICVLNTKLYFTIDKNKKSWFYPKTVFDILEYNNDNIVKKYFQYTPSELFELSKTDNKIVLLTNSYKINEIDFNKINDYKYILLGGDCLRRYYHKFSHKNKFNHNLCFSILKKSIKLNKFFVYGIDKNINSINLPDKYNVIHIRRGDKLIHEIKGKTLNFLEKQKENLENCTIKNFNNNKQLHYIPLKYHINCISNDINYIVICSDCPQMIKNEIKNLPLYYINKFKFYVCDFVTYKNGYSNSNHDKGKNNEDRYNNLINFFTDVTLMNHSEQFICTPSSNVSRLSVTYRYLNNNQDNINLFNGQEYNFNIEYIGW